MMTPYVYVGLEKYARLEFLCRLTDLILEIVCHEFGITVQELKSGNRMRKYSEARAMASYFIKKNTKHTLKEIGKILGGRDHSTIIYQIDQCQLLWEVDRLFRERMEKIENQINKIIDKY